MRLRHFLDAAYALLHEEYQRNKMTLWDASEQLAEYRSGYDPLKAEAKESVPSEIVENEKAMSELRDLMRSTGMAF